jgi:choloylglycine hydrolase
MMQARKHNPILSVIAALAGILVLGNVAFACTGITLKEKDGAVVYGRTLEWGAFDLMSRIWIIPRGHEFTGSTPDGKPGLKWKASLGIVAIDALKKDAVADGLNEKGLAVGLFYHPGFAEYQEYDPVRADRSLAPTEVAQLLLSICASIDEVRKTLKEVRVVPVVEKALGFPAPLHFIVTEPSGQAVVIEYLEGELKIYDAPLGVITNSPSYDWHLTNLRNYINLSPVALPSKKIEDLEFAPLGAGSGMIGLPGDFTPPSRFVRAVAFAKTARPTETGEETVYEVFRILDNFNVPLGAAEGSEHEQDTAGMRSSTIWTSVSDTRNKVMYYHTQHNRRVRKIDLNRIDFGSVDQEIRMPLDKKRTQDIVDMTPETK